MSSKKKKVVDNDLFSIAKDEALSNDVFADIYNRQIMLLEKGFSYNLEQIQIGDMVMNTWYKSPYPEDYTILKKIYLCEFCLEYLKSEMALNRHMAKCIWRHPPGNEIYRKVSISFFEIDGAEFKTYCQNLCLLAKLFLNHKTLFHEVEGFHFYVMTRNDSHGCHMIGYFSKEKETPYNYNLSCILTLPSHRRQGYGKMLIDFSYLLSRVADVPGTPERPLSDLGLITYRKYWASVVMHYLNERKDDESVWIRDLTQLTGAQPNDLISTLQYMGMLKYWKNQHVILKNEEILAEYEAKANLISPSMLIDETCLHWTPPLALPP